MEEFNKHRMSIEASMPEDDDSLHDLEKASFKDNNTECLGNSPSENSEMKDFSLKKNSALEN